MSRVVENPWGTDMWSHVKEAKKMTIRREAGNKDKNTFDFINVEITICYSDYNIAMQFCKENYEALANAAVSYMENSKRFVKYGVPVNCLKVENVTLQRDCVLNFLFGLKSA